MRLWGEINNAWDDIERLLYDAFDALLIDTHSFASQAIFYSQKSHAARREMVESLAKVVLVHKPDALKKLRKTIVRVKARSNDRHNLTHGTWGMSIDLQNKNKDITRIPLQADFLKPKSAYTRSKMRRIIQEMRSTSSALREAIRPLEEEKRKELMNIQKRWMDRLGVSDIIQDDN